MPTTPSFSLSFVFSSFSKLFLSSSPKICSFHIVSTGTAQATPWFDVTWLDHQDCQDGAPNWYPFIPRSTRRDAGGGTFCSGLPFVMLFTLHFFLRRARFSNKQRTRNDSSDGNTTVPIMFLMLGWAVRVFCVDLHDLSKHSFEFHLVLHIVSW